MIIPIVLTTYNRPHYLKRTIESLEKSNADLSRLYIFDDHSTDPEQVKLLSELKRKYFVFSADKNWGTMINTVKAITHAHSLNPEAEYIAFLQDDILLSKNWLADGIELYKNIDSSHKIAYINLCDRVGQKKFKTDYEVMTFGHSGGIAWIVSNKFWNEYLDTYGINDGKKVLNPNEKRDNYIIKHICDKKITQQAYALGWAIAAVRNKSLVNHVGDKSSLHNTPMNMWRSKNFVGE